ncbi:hypothetical protein QBC37DRAFT_387130 [Rhypophila decipiens]|uniref:Uncharacterized protein n=1 Tax=Rhypophila decipiens TaxID=261697 RepID=A0AAN6Y886_9PEZI|nr:hypothetical protein QBC37DRAFT_387130 [Rhypophila decipiens]
MSSKTLAFYFPARTDIGYLRILSLTVVLAMAAIHVSESLDAAFQMAVAKFAASLTDEQRKEFRGCSLKEVEQTIKDVETRLASQRRQRNMQKISNFLEGMNQLGKVIEVFVNCDSTVAFIWGPIKFVLLAVGTWCETLDCLLDTYVEIGEFLPGLSQYTTLLEKYPSLGMLLEKYYSDVLEFHRNALKVFSRPRWKIVFDSAWKTFRAEFGPILTKLKRHRELLSGESLTALVTNVHQSVQSIEDKVDALTREVQRLHLVDSENADRKRHEDIHSKRQFVLTKLKPPDYHHDFEKALNERCDSTSGDWLLADDKFRGWADMTTMKPGALYVNGIPGSGKTVITSRAIQYLGQLRENRNANGLGPLTLLQDEVLLDLIYQRCISIDQQMITSAYALRELADLVLQAQNMCFIVVDGLDECIGDDVGKSQVAQGQVIDWLESLRNVSSESSDSCMRLLISGQKNGLLDERLKDWPSVQLDSSLHHTKDIQMYCEVQSLEIPQEFEDIEGIENIRLDIIHRVTSRARGMFLYAKIVLTNLLDQPSSADFERELEEQNFPDGLDQAYGSCHPVTLGTLTNSTTHSYERVAIHVLENAYEKRYNVARRILNLVICAERLLRWREIRSHFSIDIQSKTANPKSHPRKSAKHYCGSLVEICQKDEHRSQSVGPEPEDVLELVHETARTYLLQTNRFRLDILNLEMARFCAQYMYSSPFDPDIENTVVKTHCMTGYYGFMDYAAANWWKHARRLEDSAVHVTLGAIVRLAGALNPEYKLGLDDPANDVPAIWTRMRQYSDNSRDWEREFPIQTRIQLIRSYFDALFVPGNTQSSVDMDRLREFYGSPKYKCSKPWCAFFHDGFKTISARDNHINQHNLPFRCSTDGCCRFQIGFATESELVRHNQRLHPAAVSVEFPSRRRGNIFKAAAEGQIEAIQVLVAQGASVNVRDKDGLTPLFLAARAGKCNVCRWLLEHGAELEARCTEQSLAALHAAVANDDVEVALLLIADYGANIFARTGAGEDPQTVIEQEHSTKLRTAFPAEFWIPNLSTIEQPRPQRPFKKYGKSWNVLFHQTASDGLDVDLVWNIRTEIGHTLHTPELHDGAARLTSPGMDVAISPDIKLVAAGSEDKKTRVFDIRTGDLLYCLKDHQGPILDVTFSLNVGELITSSADKTIKVWDLNSSHLTGQGAGVCKRTLYGHEMSVFGVAVTPDSKWVLSVSYDQGVQFWDIRTGYSQFVLHGHESRVTCVAVCPVAGPNNGGLFATASRTEVRIWTYTTEVQ